MNGKIHEDQIVPYKLLRKRSPMPYIVAGGAFLLVGVFRPIGSMWQYVQAAVVAYLAYAISRGIWPDRKIKIEMPPNSGDVQADQLLSEARDALVSIRESNDRIEDAKISACIEGIESTCLKILKRLEEEPALFSQLRTFLRYYLPTTKKLLSARASIEQGGARGESELRVMARTDRVLPEIQRAFEKQMDALDKHRYLDLQVEMDVLEGMLKSDGLSDMTK